MATSKNKSQNCAQNVDTLTSIKNAMESSETAALVEQVRVEDSSVAVEKAVTDFLTNKLKKLTKDDEFSDLIKMHIRQRLPEASFEELMRLNHDINIDNTKASEAVLGLFKNENSGKTIIENLRDNGVSSKAQELYDSTSSKDVLQAVSYLSQVLSKTQNIIEVKGN